MDILFITDNFYPEGNAIASRVYERACYWKKWGHQVTVITSAPNFPEGRLYEGYKNKLYHKENISGIDVIRIKTFIAANRGLVLRIFDFISFMFPAFFAGLFSKKPDVIVSTSPQFFGAISACILAKIKRVPYVLEVGDIWPASIVGVGAMRQSKIIKLLEKFELQLYRWSTSIIVVTPAFKENLTRRGIRADKITTILNGVDLRKYSPRARNKALAKSFGIPQDSFQVVYVGTLGMAHGLENVLYAAQILKTLPDIQFIFVGAGAKRDELIKLAQKLGLTNVHFLPAQAKESVPEFWSLGDVALVHLKNSDVFSEVIPSKIFEAMGMGLPVLLVAPQGEASKIIDKEQIGLWLEPDHPERLAEIVVNLYKLPELTHQFALRSKASGPFYSREQQAHRFIQILDDLISVKSTLRQEEVSLK